MPFVGNSVVYVSIIVSVFLAALATGYWYGGKCKSPLPRLQNNILFSALLVAFGFSYPVMDYYFGFFENFSSNNIIALSSFLMIFLFPVIFLLGQTIPLLTNFIKNQTVSELTGNSLSINTIGSVIGSVFTSLVSFYYLGVASTIYLSTLLLLIIYFALKPSFNIIKVLFALSIGIIAYTLNISYEKQEFVKTNAYVNYKIETKENDLFKILKMNKSISSVTINGRTYGYISSIRNQITNDLGHKDAKILVLGAGGFTLSIGDNTNNQYEYIDIDPSIKDVVEKFFLEKSIKGKFIAEDAREYIKKSDKRYHVVVVDLYINKNSIPWHVMTKEFMQSVNNILTRDGNVIMNIVQKDNFGDNVSKRIHNTIMDTFNFCYVIPHDNKTDLMNVTYNCKKQTNNSLNEIYIDDKEYLD